MTTPSPPRTTPIVPGYDIQRLIGLGGMGEVHLACQVALNRPVAIKFLTRTAAGAPEEFEARFRREAELMARVSHPNVVTIFDFGAVEGRAYLVMEFVEGGDLRARMVPDTPMPIGQVRAILGPVLKAVAYLHSREIVHRDLKPENILMLRGETPKVTDFGIAVLDFATGSLTRTGRQLGTPGYVSPEQQYGLKLDARADQFSLAALAYEMATGRKPLGAFPAPDKLNTKLGSRAAAVLLKGLAEDPADRYATISAFAEALNGALAMAEAPSRPRRRWPLLAGLPALALIAAGIYRLIALTPKPPEPEPKPPAVATPEPPKAPPPQQPGPPARLLARSVGMTLVLVPAGEFTMGSPPGDPEALPSEFPAHPVRISRPFYLGEKEVTVGQFRAYIDATGKKTSAEKPDPGGQWGGARFDVKMGRWEQRPELNWKNPGGARLQRDNEPVVQVSWDDAVDFCKWLSEREGRPFRLPTEAEWEYACRAGSTGRWCFGDDPALLDRFAWSLNNADNAFHPVGTKEPNVWGLSDMHGNAWEWCSDEFGSYDEAAAVDPQGPPRNQTRVLRGGSFDWDKVERTRSASRHHYPAYMSYYNYGFRVCAMAP